VALAPRFPTALWRQWWTNGVGQVGEVFRLVWSRARGSRAEEIEGGWHRWLLAKWRGKSEREWGPALVRG
jgi:hypothetical protein